MDTFKYKADKDKPRADLIDPYFEEELAVVLTNGAAKYGDHHWQKISKLRYVAALQRHLIEIKKGEVLSDHGTSHAVHVAACAMFIHWHDKKATLRGTEEE